jgi:hypothetical protein
MFSIVTGAVTGAELSTPSFATRVTVKLPSAW